MLAVEHTPSQLAAGSGRVARGAEVDTLDPTELGDQIRSKYAAVVLVDCLTNAMAPDG